ncbi:hypothetical protein ABK040_000730 [Willaertia magna]
MQFWLSVGASCYETFCDLKYPNSYSDKQRCIISTSTCTNCAALPRPANPNYNAKLKCPLACNTKLKFLENPVSSFKKCKKIVKVNFSRDVLKSCKNLNQILKNSNDVDESLVSLVESKVTEFYDKCSQVCNK